MATTERIERISPKKLHPTKWNPREHIRTESAAFQDLLKSVEGSGVREHLQVRPHPSKKGEYEILSGHRRALAATMAKVETVPAVVVEMDDEEAFKQVFFGNFGREDLTPAEEGRAVEILLEKMKQDKDAVAAALGKTVQWVEMRARLLHLTPQWRAEVENPDSFCVGWTIGHLGLIARLDPAMQDALLGNGHYELKREGARWTVKQLEAWLNNTFLHRLASAPWSREDATLVKAAGACTSCPKRASCQGRLFIEEEDDAARKTNDRCLDAACWHRKLEAWTTQRVEQAVAEHGGNVVLLSTQYLSYGQDKEIAKRYGKDLKVQEAAYIAAAKAGEKGAVPGIVVNGKGLGELRWVKNLERASYSSGKRRETRKPLTLKERREVLESKRLSVVLKMLRAALTREADVASRDKSGFKEIRFKNLGFGEGRPGLSAIIALAATFGTHRNNDSLWSSDQPLDRVDIGHTNNINLWERFKELSKDGGDGTEALWSCVARVLQKRLYCSQPITKTNAKYGKEAERIAKLCSIDLAPLRAEAEAAYPEPKGWKLLNADGTKKGEEKPKRFARKAKAPAEYAPAGTSQGGAEEAEDDEEPEGEEE